jgi:hypothetical protein
LVKSNEIRATIFERAPLARPYMSACDDICQKKFHSASSVIMIFVNVS